MKLHDVIQMRHRNQKHVGLIYASDLGLMAGESWTVSLSGGVGVNDGMPLSLLGLLAEIKLCKGLIPPR
jgi:hypothetical protein